MDRQKKLKIALPVLFVIMAFVWGPILLGGTRKSGQKPETSSAAGGETSTNQGDMMDIVAMSSTGIRQKARTSYDAWGQNPFMLAKPPRAIVVEGVLWDPANPQVMINGEILSVGGTIGTNVIIGIRPNSVVLQTASGETVELHMGEVKQF